MKVRVTCEGVTPLLMQKMEKPKCPYCSPCGHHSQKAVTLEDRVRACVHRNARGRPAIPVEELFSCLVNAGRMVQLPSGRKLSTATSTLVPMLLSLPGNFVPLTDAADPAPFVRHCHLVSQPNVQRQLVRAKFSTWAFQVELQVDEERLPLDNLQQLLDCAGEKIGLGAFRPAHKGTFGVFRVTDCKIVRPRKRLLQKAQ